MIHTNFSLPAVMFDPGPEDLGFPDPEEKQV
jgi:hypothetical protein